MGIKSLCGILQAPVCLLYVHGLCFVSLPIGSDSSFESLPIIPDIKAEYVEVKWMFVDVCTHKGTPTLDEIKDYCKDLIQCALTNKPMFSRHRKDVEKAKTLPELAHIVCFHLSSWISYDFFTKVITHFQPTLKLVKQQLIRYEDQLKPLLQQKVIYIAELLQQ